MHAWVKAGCSSVAMPLDLAMGSKSYGWREVMWVVVMSRKAFPGQVRQYLTPLGAKLLYCTSQSESPVSIRQPAAWRAALHSAYYRITAEHPLTSRLSLLSTLRQGGPIGNRVGALGTAATWETAREAMANKELRVWRSILDVESTREGEEPPSQTVG
ncbi:hypothetical protein DFJ77DRAFT_461966 [Powellomyces hirtus]|nr:hypothetical protein DFJ77DRAFT_461966 [Powellomyces hirtus]